MILMKLTTHTELEGKIPMVSLRRLHGKLRDFELAEKGFHTQKRRARCQLNFAKYSR